MKSEKGTTIIIMSVIVAGITMLIVSAAAENIRHSLKTQGIQQKALQNTYKAEEGVEFSYFATKNPEESLDSQYLEEGPFDIHVWEEGKEVEGDNKEKIEFMREGNDPDNYVLVSESKEGEEEDIQEHKKTIFTRNPFIPSEEEELP